MEIVHDSHRVYMLLDVVGSLYMTSLTFICYLDVVGSLNMTRITFICYWMLWGH